MPVPRLLNCIQRFMVQRFMVQRFMVQRFMVQRSMVQRFMVQRFMVQRFMVMDEDCRSAQYAGLRSEGHGTKEGPACRSKPQRGLT